MSKSRIRICCRAYLISSVRRRSAQRNKWKAKLMRLVSFWTLHPAKLINHTLLMWQEWLQVSRPPSRCRNCGLLRISSWVGKPSQRGSGGPSSDRVGWPNWTKFVKLRCFQLSKRSILINQNRLHSKLLFSWIVEEPFLTHYRWSKQSKTRS